MKIKYLTKIFDQNTLEFLASGKDLIMDRLTGSTSKLESLTRIYKH